MGSGPSTPSEPSTPAAPGDVPSDTARAEVDVDQVERLSHTQVSQMWSCGLPMRVTKGYAVIFFISPATLIKYVCM